MRRAARRDKNEPEIIEALKKHGYDVEQISSSGIPDLLVGFADKNLLMEVKDKGGKLTKPQWDFHQYWRGQKAIVKTPEEALEVAERYFNE